jgi:Ca2+-binding EF-hand superfamily protein
MQLTKTRQRQHGTKLSKTISVTVNDKDSHQFFLLVLSAISHCYQLPKKDAKTSLMQHQSQAIKDSFIVEDKDKDNIVNTSKTKTVIETSAIKDRIKKISKDIKHHTKHTYTATVTVYQKKRHQRQRQRQST